jgi:hypothetical protein
VGEHICAGSAYVAGADDSNFTHSLRL